MSINDVDDQQDAVDEGSPALSLSVQPEGLLVGGDPAAVQSYLERIRDAAGHGMSVATVDKRLLQDTTSSGTLAATLGEVAKFVQLFPRGLEALRDDNLVPWTDGFFTTAAGQGGKLLPQIHWHPIDLAPLQMLSVQTIAVQAALRVAVAEVNEAVERVEGKVDAVLQLAEATRAGDVLGQHTTVQRMLRYFDKHGSLPTSDWQSIAGLGPTLDATVEKLRTHVTRAFKDFDPNLPVGRRAEILHRAVERNQIGEALSLLVIAEESLFGWQRLRIARIAATEPEHLAQVVDDARDLLAREVVEDGKLYALGHRVLDSFSKSEALEGFFFWAVRGLAGNRSMLRADLDAFAHARLSQVTEWEEHPTPGLLDATSAAVDVVARTATEALTQAWAGVVKLGGYLRRTPAEQAPTLPDESTGPVNDE